MSSERRPGRRTVAIAQVLLVLAAAALWTASRLPWVVIRSFDGLGPPKDVTLSGASWSTALLPLAVLLLAAAIAALAVRGWPLRALAGLLAAASFAIGYLGVSFWVVPDVAARGAELAHVPLVTLVGSARRYPGAVISVVAALGTLIAAVLLLRSAATSASSSGDTTKYVTPAARRSMARQADADSGEESGSHMSERMIWDALDEGEDPTDAPRESDTEGR
ncbi:TIGR02234 family membrane protein [Mycobacterium kubicae]|uniref:TIGR02234 family membrane protein n=1 Tax=Mycobacterium kubicae TaxID=120959 RepID=UPI0016413F83|nr:TIGR02234 family membrane protein [Mycobacterium kubicae]QNI06848.1 TIGR02234 family membrane protein [Mycobacterium kubicae]